MTGNTALRKNKNQAQAHKTARQRKKTDETNLSVGQSSNLINRVAPLPGEKKWDDTLKQQHQAKRDS
jgi:hypothetical protein